MRVYETTFILNPQTDDATLDKQVKTVADLVTSNGGQILKEHRIGTRRLAYPIRKLTQGYYTTLVYKAPPEFPPTLDRHFRLGEEFLRHLTILFEGDLDKLLTKEEREQRDKEDKQETSAPPAAEKSEESTPEPETTTEEVETPEFAETESATSEAKEPEATKPEATEPEATEPEATEPKTSEEPSAETVPESPAEPDINEQYKPIDEDDQL